MFNNRSSIMVVGETFWGEMSVMTVGSFHVFLKIVILARTRQIRVQLYPEYIFWCSLCEQLISLYWTGLGSLQSLRIRLVCLSFFRTNMNDVPWISMSCHVMSWPLLRSSHLPHAPFFECVRISFMRFRYMFWFIPHMFIVFSLNFIKFHAFTLTSFSQICVYVDGFHGSRDTRSENLWHTVPPFGILCRRIRSPIYQVLELSRPGSGGLDAGCWQDWEALEVGGSRWEEGLEGIPTFKSSTLQEVVGFAMLWTVLARHCQKTNWEDKDKDKFFIMLIQKTKMKTHLIPIRRRRRRQIHHTCGNVIKIVIICILSDKSWPIISNYL